MIQEKVQDFKNETQVRDFVEEMSRPIVEDLRRVSPSFKYHDLRHSVADVTEAVLRYALDQFSLGNFRTLRTVGMLGLAGRSHDRMFPSDSIEGLPVLRETPKITPVYKGIVLVKSYDDNEIAAGAKTRMEMENHPNIAFTRAELKFVDGLIRITNPRIKAQGLAQDLMKKGDLSYIVSPDTDYFLQRENDLCNETYVMKGSKLYDLAMGGLPALLTTLGVDSRTHDSVKNYIDNNDNPITQLIFQYLFKPKSVEFIEAREPYRSRNIAGLDAFKRDNVEALKKALIGFKGNALDQIREYKIA